MRRCRTSDAALPRIERRIESALLLYSRGEEIMQTVKRILWATITCALLAFVFASSAIAADKANKGLYLKNVTGVWWKVPASSESGWGINFSHQGDIIFATWFTYDSNRNPQWFIALFTRTEENVYSG